MSELQNPPPTPAEQKPVKYRKTMVAEWVFLAVFAAVTAFLGYAGWESQRPGWYWQTIVFTTLLAMMALNRVRGGWWLTPGRMSRGQKIVGVVIATVGLAAAVGGIWSMAVQAKIDSAIRDAGGYYDHREHRARFDGSKVNDASLATLKGVSGVRSVTIADCTMTAVGLKPLADLPELRELAIRGVSGLTDAAMEEVARLGRLERLEIWDSPQMTEAALARIKTMGRLKSLKFSLPYNSEHKLTDAGVSHIAAMRGLEALRLSAGTKLTDAAMPMLAGLANLRELELSAYDITPKALGELKGLPGLETLELHAGVTPETVTVLAALPALRNLTVGYVSRECFRPLGGMKGLRELSIRSSSCRDEDLLHLAGSPAVRKLDLDGSGITDAGVEFLVRMPNLRELGLASSKISNDGVAMLAGQTKLRDLTLSDTDITDGCLGSLEKLPRLRFLRLQNSWITAGGVERLKKSNSDLSVIHTPWAKRD